MESIKGIAKEILNEQSAGALKRLREPYMKLLVNGVPNEIIIINLVKELCLLIKSEEIKIELIKWASFYDNR